MDGGSSSTQFSGHQRRQKNRADEAYLNASPTKFRDPHSPSPSSRPDVYSRELTRLHASLGEEMLAMKADLSFMEGELKEEMKRVEQTLGSDGLDALLDHLEKTNPHQHRELQAYADELTGVLATAKVLRELHSSVKVMHNWDTLSREVLEALNSRQTSANVLTVRKQALLYYVWSAFSLGRAAAFSCYLANVAGSAIPSLVLAGAIVVPAGLHTMIMVRDHFRLQENYYKNRSAAFENMGRALRGVQNWPACSADDAMAMLAFRDAISKLPENSPSAALDAKRARIAAIRDQAVMPVNVLASCIGQILSLASGPQWASSLLLILSSVGYLGQGVLDLLQGHAEHHKATGVADHFRNWLATQPNSHVAQQWALHDVRNMAALKGLQAHYERALQQQGPELFGATAREVKGVFNFVNSILAVVAGTLPLFNLAPKGMATMAGVVASSVSLLYMAGTATKVMLRGDVKEQAKERYRQAQLMLANFSTAELLNLVCNSDGQSLSLQVPHGAYDEREGFTMTKVAVRPWENEFVALEILARVIDDFALDKSEVDSNGTKSIGYIMNRIWNMKAIEWVNLLRIASGMRDAGERIAFIKQRLASVVKVDFNLGPDHLEPALPAEVVVHAFLRKLDQLDYINLQGIYSSATDSHQGIDPEAGHGGELRSRLSSELEQFGEDAFLVAMDKVWHQRHESTLPTQARLKLFALNVLAKNLAMERKVFAQDLLRKLKGKDGDLLKKTFPNGDPESFVEAVRQLLDAPPAARALRRGALFHLARMKLTQDLLVTQGLLQKLESKEALHRVFGLVDRNVGPAVDADEEYVYAVDVSSEDAGSASDFVDTVDSDSISGEAAPNRQASGPRAPSMRTLPALSEVTLRSLIRNSFGRKSSSRAQVVLKTMVGQLPNDEGQVPRSARNSSRFLATPNAKPGYTPVQPPQTPLTTPRVQVSTPAQTPLRLRTLSPSDSAHSSHDD